MKQYACLGCGFVHEGKIIKRERVDVEGAGPGAGGFIISPFHGFITYRVCPECGNKQLIERREDEKAKCL